MSDKFTLRDFLVYFTTGAITILSFDMLYFWQILDLITDFFNKYSFIKEFSGLLIVIIIPLIYFVGHLIHAFGFLSLLAYKWIHRTLTDLNWRKYKPIEWIRLVLHFFMYKNKVINSIVTENKSFKTWNSDNSFWVDCASLQKKGQFGPAEYWYTLNDLFKGLYTSFLFTSIIAIVIGNFLLGFVYIGLFLLCHFRAIQFADFFVKTVKRLMNE